MGFSRSLKFKLSIGIIVVMLPLVIFTFYNNINARQVVQEKVSESYTNTMSIFVDEVDLNLLQINDYLYKMGNQDLDVGQLRSYPIVDDEYILTKIRIQQKLIRDIGFYPMIDTIFIYTMNDLLFFSETNEIITTSVIRNNIDHLLELEKTQGTDDWHLLNDEQIEGEFMLARIYELNTGIYGGVLVKVEDIAKPLDVLWNKGKIGDTVIYSRLGMNLTESLHAPKDKIMFNNLKPEDGLVTQTIEASETHDRFFVIGKASEVADLMYNIIIPEKSMLNNIPFLQKATYFIPLGIVIILLLFLFFINEVMFKPLADLIRGMKRISMGLLDSRLEGGRTTEFNFLANSFNNMAKEVENLKIDVYEEQLRAQQAEFKHLQAQISPHFYMNSLNIIYNFAALGDHQSIKKMSLHLADYFRFIMKTNRTIVTLEEELNHISNYIEIQKIRFPNKLQFDVNIEGFSTIEIPALIIQPFVENAIIHGFKNRKQTFRILVMAEPAGLDYRCKVSIHDNGVGLTEDVIKNLNEDLPLEQKESSRLGIKNVMHRLQLHYEGEAIIQFSNGEHGGALIEIYFPNKPNHISEKTEER
ncbi:MAG: histidine kinase [Bacilli bacterium]